MHPDIEELVVRAVFAFAGANNHYTVLMPVLSWERPGGELQWTLITPKAMSKCACVARAWSNALAQRKKLHLAQIAARAVKMSIEYGLGVCEVERYLHADIHGAPQTTTFRNTLRLDKEHVFFINFTRQRVHPLKDDHVLACQVGIPLLGADGLSVSHVSALPASCWVDASEMRDSELDEYRVWYFEKKRELKTWLETQLVLFGVMPLEHM
jgi:hypothetical protein